MERIRERRTHRRLDIQMLIEYKALGVGRRNVERSVTMNVSTGGVYFETTNDDIKVGDLLAMELGVTSDDNRFPKNSKISTIGKVVRSAVLETEADDQASPAYSRYGIAARFSKGFKLTV